LYPGFPIGQLILLENGRLADETRPLSAAYVGPIEPEPPALRHPKMGIQRYRNPHFTDWRGTNE